MRAHLGQSSLVSLSLILAFCMAAPASAFQRSVGWQLQFGWSQIFDPGHAPELGLEIQLPQERFGIYPVVGVMVAEQYGQHVYLCMARDFRLSSRFALTALTGVAAYEPGDKGLELGGVAQFRSSIALSFRWSENFRVAVLLSHLSNAGLRKRNPGTESLSFGVRWDR